MCSRLLSFSGHQRHLPHRVVLEISGSNPHRVFGSALGTSKCSIIIRLELVTIVRAKIQGLGQSLFNWSLGSVPYPKNIHSLLVHYFYFLKFCYITNTSKTSTKQGGEITQDPTYHRTSIFGKFNSFSSSLFFCETSPNPFNRIEVLAHIHF